jgi:hypothetical protein
MSRRYVLKSHCFAEIPDKMRKSVFSATSIDARRKTPG